MARTSRCNVFPEGRALPETADLRRWARKGPGSGPGALLIKFTVDSPRPLSPNLRRAKASDRSVRLPHPRGQAIRSHGRRPAPGNPNRPPLQLYNLTPEEISLVEGNRGQGGRVAGDENARRLTLGAGELVKGFGVAMIWCCRLHYQRVSFHLVSGANGPRVALMPWYKSLQDMRGNCGQFTSSS